MVREIQRKKMFRKDKEHNDFLSRPGNNLSEASAHGFKASGPTPLSVFSRKEMI